MERYSCEPLGTPSVRPAILWILWTGAPWSELPRQYGSAATCWRRLRDWEEAGTLLALWRAFLAELNDREKLRGDECFADGSFAPDDRFFQL